MRLDTLLELAKIKNNSEKDITGYTVGNVCCDSRRADGSSVFVCVSGAAADGISKLRNITATSTAPNSTAITPDNVTAEMSFA